MKQGGGCGGYNKHMKTERENKKDTKIVVAVSGGFDPVHAGHIRMFREAKKLGDELVVIVNNDNWLTKKKGKPFIHQDERKEIVEAIRYVDRVVLTSHIPGSDDRSVCRELEMLRPDIFANGGDRTKDNIPEVALCERINCRMVFNVGDGGKIQSSSALLSSYFNQS